MKNEMMYIYEVYKEKSFSQAAKNLFVSQPALSAAIRKAEDDLGLKIFDRNSLPIRLTEAGKLYIEAVQKILSIEKELSNHINELTNLQRGQLILAGANFFSACMLPPIIHAFTLNYPGIDVELVESDSNVLYDEALNDNIDLILDAGTYDNNLFTAEPLFIENILFAVPINNPINKSFESIALTSDDIMNNRHLESHTKAVDISAYANENFVLLKKGHDMHARSIAICKNAGFTPNAKMYLNQLSTAANMVNQGLGCSFITDTLVHLTPYSHSSMLYYLIDDSNAHRNVFMAHQKTKTMTQAMHKFIQLAKEIYKQNIVE